jgi:hypothetical protein
VIIHPTQHMPCRAYTTTPCCLTTLLLLLHLLLLLLFLFMLLLLLLLSLLLLCHWVTAAPGHVRQQLLCGCGSGPYSCWRHLAPLQHHVSQAVLGVWG